MIRFLQLHSRRLLHRYLRLNLRERIAGAMLALVTIAAILVAVVAHFAGERLEENVNYDLLAEELTHYQQRLRADASAAPLMSASLHIYRSINMADLPREIARLSPGIHRTIRRDGHSFRVLVRDSEFGRLYITYDVTEHERGQRIALLVLIASVVAILLLTTWAAFRLAQPLLAPVDRLAAKLANMDPGQRNLRFVNEFSGNELEPIARSIDSFLERLDGFVEREQAFTATASHELRTPLSVIQGAVELLTEQQAAQSTPNNALARIQRAVREMSEFTTALLSLAREPDENSVSDSSCDVAALIRRITDELRIIAPGKIIEVENGESFRVFAPDTMVAMVIGNVIRNALQHGTGDRIHCRQHDRTFTVTNAGSISNEHLPLIFKPRFTTASGGYGMGLYIVHRICERYGWRIDITSNNTDTVATLTF